MKKHGSEIEWTDAKLMAARAIWLIENKLEPTCEECGYGANRSNCAMGYDCSNYKQENVIAFSEVIETLEKESGLCDYFNWQGHYPLEKVHSFSDEEKNLILDLYDQPDHKLISRHYNNQYSSLSDKNVCVYSSRGDRWYISFTKRGLDLAIKLQTNPVSVP